MSKPDMKQFIETIGSVVDTLGEDSPAQEGAKALDAFATLAFYGEEAKMTEMLHRGEELGNDFITGILSDETRTKKERLQLYIATVLVLVSKAKFVLDGLVGAAKACGGPPESSLDVTLKGE